MDDLSAPLWPMKRIIILLLALMIVASCHQSANTKVIIKGDRSTYAMIDSTVYLATQDTVEFAVKIYEGEYGLMLETPKPLSGNLFGIKSSEGRLKYSFTFFDFINNKYQYIIYYNEFPSFWGAYYLQNLEHCWIFYQYDDYSNNPDMVEFSADEFNAYFRKTKAHIICF